MQEKKYNESDGRCFADTRYSCGLLLECEDGCGTYECKFYKPKGCRDWVRIDTEEVVQMYAPEELGERTRYYG